MDRNRIVPAHTVDTTVDNRGHAHRGHSGVGLNTPVDTVVDGQESPTPNPNRTERPITMPTILHPGDLVAVLLYHDTGQSAPVRYDLAIERVHAIEIPDDDVEPRYFIEGDGWVTRYESDPSFSTTIVATVPTGHLFDALHALFDRWAHEIGEFDEIRKWLTPEQQEILVVILAGHGRFFTPEDMAS